MKRSMPVTIYNEDTIEKIALLCDNSWDLPTQVSALETWLINDGKALAKGKYIADIGFAISKDAKGGGCAITSEMMNIMSEIGIDIYLSEYPTLNRLT
jgi:hypothetical protein